jgi:hypothetical protein|uniref:Uncharacterized protein n=1 Tax=Desulfobacca acetoxidans TaxID=60893 RepID=A0A7C3Z8H8_9BACT
MHLGIRKGIRGRWGLFILLLVFLWPILVLALSASQVFEQVKDSVVVVKALDRQGKQQALPSGPGINYKLIISLTPAGF